MADEDEMNPIEIFKILSERFKFLLEFYSEKERDFTRIWDNTDIVDLEKVTQLLEIDAELTRAREEMAGINKDIESINQELREQLQVSQNTYSAFVN